MIIVLGFHAALPNNPQFILSHLVSKIEQSDRIRNPILLTSLKLLCSFWDVSSTITLIGVTVWLLWFSHLYMLISIDWLRCYR